MHILKEINSLVNKLIRVINAIIKGNSERNIVMFAKEYVII